MQNVKKEQWKRYLSASFYAFTSYFEQAFSYSFDLIPYLIFYIVRSVLYLDSTHLTNDSIDPTLIVCRRISGMFLLHDTIDSDKFQRLIRPLLSVKVFVINPLVPDVH